MMRHTLVRMGRKNLYSKVDIRQFQRLFLPNISGAEPFFNSVKSYVYTLRVLLQNKSNKATRQLH